MATQSTASIAGQNQRAVAALIVLCAATIWAYWTTLAAVVSKWEADPQYSHGYLVPLFSVALLYLRRDMIAGRSLTPSWWGLPILLVGVGLRLLHSFYYIESIDSLSLLPTLAGITVLVGGWQALRWAWPAIAFLFFMLPLPYSIEVALRYPLRTIGTKASTYVMQTLGLPAVAEGHVIRVNDFPIGVAEACSGLSMLMIFFALATAVAILAERPLWEKLVIVASAVVIALIANITRITVIGIMYLYLDKETVDKIFHEYVGWFMMIYALLLLWGELWLLSRLFVAEDDRPMVAGLGVAAPRGR